MHFHYTQGIHILRAWSARSETMIEIRKDSESRSQDHDGNNKKAGFLSVLN